MGWKNPAKHAAFGLDVASVLELPYFDRLVAAMRALHAEEKQWGKVFMDDCGRLLPLKDAIAAADATWMSATLHGNTQALTSPLRATQQR